MGFLRRIFGASKAEALRQLCGEIGTEFAEEKFSQSDKVVAQVKRWTVTLDTLTVAAPEGATATYTRIRAPYVNKDGFRFKIHRRRAFDRLRKKPIGMWDIKTGYPEFDRQFTIKGNDESKVRVLFADPRIRQLIQSQPSIYLEVRHDMDGLGSTFPAGVDQLYFHEGNVIKDVERLKSLYDLFAEMLNHLCCMGSASEDNPNFAL